MEGRSGRSGPWSGEWVWGGERLSLPSVRRTFGVWFGSETCSVRCEWPELLAATASICYPLYKLCTYQYNTSVTLPYKTNVMHGLGNYLLFHFSIRTPVLIQFTEQLRSDWSNSVNPSCLGLAIHNPSPTSIL